MASQAQTCLLKLGSFHSGLLELHATMLEFLLHCVLPRVGLRHEQERNPSQPSSSLRSHGAELSPSHRDPMLRSRESGNATLINYSLEASRSGILCYIGIANWIVLRVNKKQWMRYLRNWKKKGKCIFSLVCIWWGGFRKWNFMCMENVRIWKFRDELIRTFQDMKIIGTKVQR